MALANSYEADLFCANGVVSHYKDFFRELFEKSCERDEVGQKMHEATLSLVPDTHEYFGTWPENQLHEGIPAIQPGVAVLLCPVFDNLGVPLEGFVHLTLPKEQ